MKTLFFYILIPLIAIVSCKTADSQAQEKVSFEIHETLAQKEVPADLIEEFRQMNIRLNTDTLSPIIAYVPIDSTILFSELADENVKFLQTAQSVDKDKKYSAVVALKKQSYLNSSHIKRTKPNQNNIEIYFNLQGANKWADFTKICIGKLVAFTVDNEIYTLTTINREIRNGTAILNGLENDDMAAKISKSINSSL
ncbi:MAG: hypothetical protein GY790_08905 [Bacteroidetes bacterium]|nr:hypothetical protein [Bacteroidota bacterium]